MHQDRLFAIMCMLSMCTVDDVFWHVHGMHMEVKSSKLAYLGLD